MSVRIALIGCGKIVERLALPQLAAYPHAEIVALVDHRRTAAERLARHFGIDRRRIWTDWRRMLRDADADAVAVCVPNHLHAEVAMAALAARKHVLVEKPMALTLADADAMLAAARRYRRCLMVEQTQRFDPIHEVAYDTLRRGLLGRITQVRGRLGHAGPEYWSGRRRSWLTTPAHAGGGALMDLGAHLIDLLRWLTQKEVRRICCQAKTLEKRVAVEDNASALLEFTDGTIGSFDVSWTTRPYEVTTMLYGQRGTLRTTVGATQPVSIQLANTAGDPNHRLGPVRHPRVPAASRHGGPYRHFIDCIRLGKRPLVSGTEGRATLAVILAAYASARTGRWVTL